MNYDEKAKALTASWGSWNETEIRQLAAVFRRVAAETYEDAATQADGFWINMPGQSRGKALGDALRLRASALKEAGHGG